MEQRKSFLMTILLIIPMFLVSGPAVHAYYQINAEDYPKKGTATTFTVDTTGSIDVDLGAAGTGQTWDFTQALTGIEFQREYSDANVSAFYSQELNAAEWVILDYQWLSNEAIPGVTDDPIRGLFNFDYFERMENDTVFGVGAGLNLPPFINVGFPYENESINYPLPLEYNKSWVRKAVLSKENIVVTYLGLQAEIDIVVTDSSNVIVDGEGDLTIPTPTSTETYPCLRLKIHRNIQITILLSATKTPIYTTEESVIIYEWHTNEVGLLLLVASHDNETNENFTNAGLVVRMLSIDNIAPVEYDPDSPSNSVPTKFALGQNFPNPFNPTTSIRYALPKNARVELMVFGILGQTIAVLESSIKTTGEHDAVWDGKDMHGRDVPGGIYFYQMKATPLDGSRTIVQTKKMIITK